MKDKLFTNNNFSITGIASGIILVVFFFATTPASTTFKSYLRTFKVSPENPALTLSSPAGSIKVVSWEKGEIKVSGTLDETLEVTEKQQGSSVSIDVKCPKIGRANFEVNVPQNCTLDLKCLNGVIEIFSGTGPIVAQTTEGEITLTDILSSNVTAKSTSGAISFKGKLSQKGIYNFSSLENTVNVSLPSESSFTLSATASSEKIDLGGFELTDPIRHERRLSGKHSGGGASLNLSTHRGKIRLSKIFNK